VIDMDARATKSSDEKDVKRKPYASPRLVNFGQVEMLTKTGGNTTADEDAHKKNLG
jgi:hypothetical protein